MAEQNENLQRVGRIVKSAVVSGATQGPGRAVDAEKVARAAQRRLVARRRRKGRLEAKKAPKKKLTGVMFYVILSVTIIKDLFDVVFALTVILSFLGVLFGLLVTFVVLIYYFFNQVNLTSRKLVVFFVATVIEILPFVGILPMASVSLILVRHFENNKKSRKFAHGKVGGALGVVT